MILSACAAKCLSYNLRNRNSLYRLNNFGGQSESYSGPSSYTTSFSSDYPGYGNFGPMMNVKNPLISSSYSSYGPSEGNGGFGSTSYVNYPQSDSGSSQNQGSFKINQLWPSQSSSSNFGSAGYSSSNHASPNFGSSSFSSSDYPPNHGSSGFSSSSYSPNHGSSSYSLPNYGSSSQSSSSFQDTKSTFGEATPISQHVEITKPVAVPVYKKFPYPGRTNLMRLKLKTLLSCYLVAKRFPVAIPHPVLVPVPAPYPGLLSLTSFNSNNNNFNHS